MDYITKGCAYLFSILALIFSTQAISYDAVFNISGAVRAGTCSLSTPKSLDVGLGDHLIGANDFGKKIGSKTKGVRWELNFNCPEGVGIVLYPQGNTYSGSEDAILGLRGADSAKGVGIETSHSLNLTSWWIIRLYSRLSVRSPSASAGPFTVYFNSYYKQMIETITPGTGNATMELDVIYN